MNLKLKVSFLVVLFFSGIALSQTQDLTLYNNSEGTPIFDLLKAKLIDIEIYEMKDPDIRAAIRVALDKKSRVRIAAEAKPLKTNCPPFEPVNERDSWDCKDQKRLVAEVNATAEKTGSAYVPFNRKTLCKPKANVSPPTNARESCFEHGKMIIADRTKALVSSGNFNSTSLCDQKENPEHCTRDYTMTTTDGDVVGTLQKVFDSDLKGVSYDLSALLDDKVKSKMTVSPFSLAPIIAFIKEARSTLQIENQYLHDADMNDAIANAASQWGVKVRVMTASVCYFRTPTATDRKLTTKVYTQFDGAGVQSKFFTKKIRINDRPGYLHAKAIVVDGKKAWVGSVNGSAQALSQNREFGLFFQTPSEVEKLSRIMDQDWNEPSAETWKESLNCQLDK